MNKKITVGTLEKITTGLSGLDQLTHGGLPARRLTLLSGPPGSGKTVLSLQTLVNYASQGHAGVFVSFCQTPRQVADAGSSFGWNIAELERNRLVFLDARPRPSTLEAEAFDVTGLLGGLRAIASEIQASFVVFDSIDVMLALLGDKPTQLQEIFRLTEWLAENRMTALVTATSGTLAASAAEKIALLEWVSECSVCLDFNRISGQAARAVRIEKYRGSAFSEYTLPFVISERGIKFAPVPATGSTPAFKTGSRAFRAEIEMARSQLTDRVRALDRFLEVKQAELNFLMEKQHTPARARRPSKSKSTSRPASQMPHKA